MSETIEEVPDGRKASYVLGVLAHLLHRDCAGRTCTEIGRLPDTPGRLAAVLFAQDGLFHCKSVGVCLPRFES